MGRQLGILILAAGALGAGCGENEPGTSGTGASSPAGVRFAAIHHHFGTVEAGTVHFHEFEFEAGAAAVITRFDVSCGCVQPTLQVGGQPVDLPFQLEAGSRGQLRVGMNTAGFLGDKDVTVRMLGSGPGLPTELVIGATIEPYWQIEPSPLRMGVLEGGTEHRAEVVVSAPEPFSIDKEFYVAPPLKIEGIPTAAAAKTHRLTVVVPVDAPDGVNRGQIKLSAAGRSDLLFWVEYDLQREVWVKPSRVLPLGPVPAGAEIHATVDVGARRGGLALPEARFEGIPGARVDCVPLSGAPNRYRVRVSLPGDLPAGPVYGQLHIDLRHTSDGREEVLSKTVTITAVVQKA